ncbi:MAG TPA: MFS transporter [Bacteroidota bacterium]|jgi:MFS family permease|nr:MFS transporter [Bacteroidota bacterium]
MIEDKSPSLSGIPQLGIRANLPQFSLLILINAFVGAMVGMERSILPLIAEQEFGIGSHSAILSFLISFGVVKAFSNLFAGTFSDRAGRKRLLVAGWLFGIPVPFLLMWAPSWSWIVGANILLGVNQGLCWSTTVIMKIDLAGPKQRGMAMGLNEFAGYLAVALAAYFTAIIADQYGLRPAPFYLGAAIAVAGFLLSIFLVKETHHFATLESASQTGAERPLEPVTPNLSAEYVRQTRSTMSLGRADVGLGSASSSTLQTNQLYSFGDVFSLTSWKNANLFSCSQAGLVNNLNDGMAWALLPLFFASLGFSIGKIGFLAALYPATWGVAQLITGAMSDNVGRKWMIASGMWVQAAAIWLLVFETHYDFQIIALILLGIGTAMVYPTLLAAVSDASHPSWRASAVGVYRLWRDLGYALGAILAGILADRFGADRAILAVGALTFLSGVIVAIKFQETDKSRTP